MRKIRYFLPLVVVLIGIVLAGCTRSASDTSEALPTSTIQIPFPVATEASSMHEILSGTQTALAAQANTPTMVNPVDTPVPTNTTVPPTPVFTRPETWTLQKGEHAWCLARRYDVNVSTLLSLNGLGANANYLPVGTVMKIPQSGNWNTANGSRALRSHPTTYTVTSGDTLWKVACYFGDLDPNAIIAVNGLSEPYALTSGQQLQIP